MNYMKYFTPMNMNEWSESFKWTKNYMAMQFPTVVHQWDAPVYYLHVILLIWNILTRTTEVMDCEQIRENVWRNVNGGKDCKKTIIHRSSVFSKKFWRTY